MKGRFSIKHCPYTHALSFGNLPQDEGFDLGHSTRNSYNPSLIAHDVVEHSVAHRTKKYITYEEELRAIGGSWYVRDEVFYYDIAEQIYGIKCLCERAIKKPPLTICRHIDKTFSQSSFDFEKFKKFIGLEVEVDPPQITEEDLEIAYYQVMWGYLIKMWHEGKLTDSFKAAFQFIEKNIGHAIEELPDSNSYGVSVYFDTHKHIFRWRHFRKPR